MKKLSAVLTAAGLLGSGASFAAGTISGVVTFDDTAPKPAMIRRTSDASGEVVQRDGRPFDLRSRGKIKKRRGPGDRGAPDTAKPAAEPVIVEQKNCAYSPRVQATTEGTKLEIKNDDGTLHNVHSYEGTKTLFNQAQPPNSKPLEKDVPKTANVVKLKVRRAPVDGGLRRVEQEPVFRRDWRRWLIHHQGCSARQVHSRGVARAGGQDREVTVADGATATPKLAFSAK